MQKQDSKVLSVKEIPIAELSDETLEDIFQQSPDFVCEFRPEWVRKNHPEKLH